MNVHDIKVWKRENKQDVEVSLSDYKGKVLLIVNTATACGLTPQYEALETMYRKYKDQGFVVLDFPCNQFMEQAKQDDEGITQFCNAKYDTTFPRFKKVDVNGDNASPLFKYLKEQKPSGRGSGNILMNCMLWFTSKINGKSGNRGDIKWNFAKFLVDREGNVVERFDPTVTPDKIAPFIEKLL
ncbi:MAG: glutathione peroxidase [Bacteroidales bacterium]|nr:glutathione peroxidase [Bacteroidales bacterium]